MWFFSENLFDYLRERSTTKKIVDVLLVATLFTWIATVYVVATNYQSIRQAFIKPVDVKTLVQLDKSINDVLTNTMNKVESDRAALGRFHNSVLDVAGRHFVYQSRSNEVVQPGVAMVTPIRQNTLLSMINRWAQQFVKDECVYMTEIAPTDMYYEYYRQAGVKSDIKCPVNGTDGRLVGFIDVEYTTRTVSVTELKTKEAIVRDASAKIGAILSVKGE